MTVAYIDTVLEILAGVSLLLALVMALSWGGRTGSPGFGRWTISNLLLAVCCLLVAHEEHFHRSVIGVLVPAVVVFAAVLRLEGLRRFLGRPGFDYRTLAIPAVVFALLAYFWFGSPNDLARALIMTVSIALIFWVMAGVIVPRAGQMGSRSRWFFGTLYAAYGALLMSYAGYWAAGPNRLPLLELSPENLVFAILMILCEIAWVVILIYLGTQRETQMLQAARAAAESGRQQLATLVDFLPDATFAVDADHIVIGWNRAAEELTGVPAADVLGKKYEEFGRIAMGGGKDTLIDLVLDPTKEIPPYFDNVSWDGERLSAERDDDFPFRALEGRQLWLTATVIRDAAGAVIGAVESMRDVSSRELAARAIRQRERQFRSLFELNLDGILAIAPDGSIVDANPAACRMLRMTKEEICAAGPASLVERGAEELEQLVARFAPGHELEEVTLVRKDGSTFPSECMLVTYEDDLGLPRAFVVCRDVTEQREAQRVLRASEERLLQALAAAKVGSWEIDLVGRSLWMSPEALHIHGLDGYPPYVPLDSIDRSRFFVDPDSVLAAMRKLDPGAGVEDIEYEVRRPGDGVIRRVRAKAQAVWDQEGRPVRAVGVLQDITELRQVEDALRLTQYSVDHAGDQIFWVTEDGRFTYVSESTCEQLGYSRDELLGMNIVQVALAGPEEWRCCWEIAETAGVCTRETVYRAKDGRDIPVEVSLNHISHGGQEYGFVAARDISGRKAREEALQRTELSVDHANDQVFWTSPEGRFVFVSDSTCRQLGYSREELLRMSIYDVDPTLTKDWRASWDKVKQRGSVMYETVYRTKDGRDIPVEVSANYISYDCKEYNLVFARDISERKHAEQMLELDQEKVRENDTMEAISQLAGGIAHDFNNLLTAIIGYGNLILANEEVQGVVSREAEEIRAAAVRASALTHQILAFARRQTLQPQVITLNQLVTRMLPRLKQILGENVEVASQLQSEPSYVEVDVAQFEQVLANLAANSHDAMPDGGRVIIEVRDVYLDEDYCRVYSDLQPGNYVLLSLADTGVGMDFEIMGHIFEPFFTTKPPGSGSGAGLGLSTVYGIVRQSGGYINVYSEIGKGTTFKIYLPSVPAKPGATGGESGAVQFTPSAGSETVLVVEDEAPLRRLVARVLGSLGYKVYVAGSGPEALELLDDLETQPDLLLTDVVLPGGMLGNEVAAVFTERVADLAVLYVSGHARDAIVHSGHLDEGVNFLGKPFTPESLAGKVREVLDAKRKAD